MLQRVPALRADALRPQAPRHAPLQGPRRLLPPLRTRTTPSSACPRPLAPCPRPQAPPTRPQIPPLIIHAVMELENRDYELGLYRVPGSAATVNALLEKHTLGRGVPDFSKVPSLLPFRLP